MAKWSNFDIKRTFAVNNYDELEEIIKSKEGYVVEYKIPKSNGRGFRKITNPTGKLRKSLMRLSKGVLNAYRPHKSAHGFVKGKGVVTNAKTHLGANAVGSIDLKDFFDTVGEKHLKNALFGNKRICKGCKNFDDMCQGKCNPSLYKNKNKNYEHKCEEILSVYIPGWAEEHEYVPLIGNIIKMSIWKGGAAQGFPTSPALANVACKGMDKMLEEQCAENNIVYTRYADDLSFSTKDHDKIWLKDKTLGMTSSIVKSFGFTVNKKKTKYTGKGGRMMVCGVVINDKLSLPKWKVKQFRAKVHHATIKFSDKTTKSMVKKLKGFASWLTSVNPSVGGKYMSQLISFESKVVSWPDMSSPAELEQVNIEEFARNAKEDMQQLSTRPEDSRLQ